MTDKQSSKGTASALGRHLETSKMEIGQAGLAELCQVLADIDATAFVRLAIDNAGLRVLHVDAVVAPPVEPAGWHPLVWHYKAATFIAARVSSRALSAALGNDDAQVFAIDGLNLTLPKLPDEHSWQHMPGLARYDSIQLPWPTLIHELAEPTRQHGQQAIQGYLIGDDCPSFWSYEAAFRTFFYRDFGRSGANLPSSFATVRLVDSRAWLDRVLITPTALKVGINGADVAGTRLELNGSTYRTSVRIEAAGPAELALPDGLPAGSWLYLTRDKHWLDYRAIGDYATPADLARAGVDMDLPEDPESVIQALRSQGEGIQVEYKRQLPDDSNDSKRTVFKTVAAFANGHGGSIVFGIEKDEATVCGLEGIDPLKARDRLTQLTRALVTPAPEVEARQYELDGKTLIVLAVERGSDPPYGITLPGMKDKPVEFYVRRDATTFPARSDEIRSTVLASVPAPSPPAPWARF